MHPSVDDLKTPHLAIASATRGIHVMSTAARDLFKEVIMRTTLTLLALTAACVDTGHLRYTHDGGTDADDGDCQTIKQQLTINDNVILDAPTSCWVLDGDLAIAGAAVTSVAKLNGLAKVTGNLEIGNTNLAKLDTSRVVAVQGAISIHDNGALTDISQLSASPLAATKYLAVDYNPKLATVGSAFAGINYVAGGVSFTHDGATSLDLHGLHQVDFSVTVANDAQLASVDLSGLQRVGGLSVTSNAVLASIDLGSINSMGDVTFRNNPALATLPMSPAPSLIGAVTIDSNAALTDLGQLSHAGTINGALQITNNAKLPYCAAHEVDCCVASGAVTITGEDNTNTNCHSYCFTNNVCPH